MEQTQPQPGDRIIPYDDQGAASAGPTVAAVLNPVDPDHWLVTDGSDRACVVREGTSPTDPTVRVWVEVLFKEDVAVY